MLASDTHITRQTVTKHLHRFENIGIVISIKNGWESLYGLDSKPRESVQEYLAVIALAWGSSLNNLKTFFGKNINLTRDTPMCALHYYSSPNYLGFT